MIKEKIKEKLKWAIAVGFLMYAIAHLFVKDYIASLLTLIAVIFFVPPITRILKERVKIKFTYLNNWIVIFFALMLAVGGALELFRFSKSYVYYNKAKENIEHNNFEKSNTYIKKSYNEFSSYTYNKQLYQDFKKFNDDDFFNQVYFDMSNKEYKSLLKNNYSKEHMNNSKINELFVMKLRKHSSNVDSIINKFNYDKKIAKKRKIEMINKIFNRTQSK